MLYKRLVQDTVSYHEFNHCALVEQKAAENWKLQIANAEVNTPLKVLSANWLDALDTQRVVALVELSLPNGAVPCEYLWSDVDHNYLKRAPWEDASTPDKRYIGFRGKSYTSVPR